MGCGKIKEENKIIKIVLVELLYDNIISYPKKLIVRHEFNLNEKIKFHTNDLHLGFILNNDYLRMESINREHFYIVEKDNIWIHSHKGRYI